MLTLDRNGIGRAARTRQVAARRGVTMMELMLVVVVTGIIGAASVPKLSRLTARSNTSRAAEVVRSDLERAFAIAARLRKPVQIVADQNAHIYQIVDQTGGTVRLTRSLALKGDIGVETMTFYPTTVTIQPNGVASDSIGVTLTSRGSTQRVSMTRVGLVRRTQ